MSTDDNKAIYRSFIERAFNNGDLSAIDDLFAAGYVNHDAPSGKNANGAEGVKAIITIFRTAFPDLHVNIEEQVAEGDFVCNRAMTSGTHQGEFFGAQPSQRQIAMPGMTMVRVVDGKIAEAWVRNDMDVLMRQIGGG
jgi:steroid delta-isomerase-like uncharacterized protein